MDTMSCSSTTLTMPSKTEILINKTCDVHGYCRGPSLGHTYYISVRDAIIIGSVLGVAIIALLVLAIHCWRRRMMKKRRDRKGKQVMAETSRTDSFRHRVSGGEVAY